MKKNAPNSSACKASELLAFGFLQVRALKRRALEQLAVWCRFTAACDDEVSW